MWIIKKEQIKKEIADNIKKLPATKRVLFLESNYDSLPEDKMDKIIKESQAVLSFKLDNLEKLKKLVKCAILLIEVIPSVLRYRKASRQSRGFSFV